MKSIPVSAALVSLLLVPACAALEKPACEAGTRASIQDTLYFGTGKTNGVVTAEEWSRFLETTVTPRFPQGLTISEASGQWRDANGSLVHEATHVLQLVHPGDAASENSITEIVSAYKKQFQQEAVLRVKDSVCVSF